MSRKISPKLLRNNLWRTGPYIFYFTSFDRGINKYVIPYINRIAKISPFVDVLEVEWEKYVKYEG